MGHGGGGRNQGEAAVGGDRGPAHDVSRKRDAELFSPRAVEDQELLLPRDRDVSEIADRELTLIRGDAPRPQDLALEIQKPQLVLPDPRGVVQSDRIRREEVLER